MHTSLAVTLPPAGGLQVLPNHKLKNKGYMHTLPVIKHFGAQTNIPIIIQITHCKYIGSRLNTDMLVTVTNLTWFMCS